MSAVRNHVLLRESSVGRDLDPDSTQEGARGSEKPLLYCPVSGCEARFTLRTNLTRHLRQHEVGKGSFACDLCRRSYSRSDDLRAHKRKAHSIEDPQRKLRPPMYAPSQPVHQPAPYSTVPPTVSSSICSTSSSSSTVSSTASASSAHPSSLSSLSSLSFSTVSKPPMIPVHAVAGLPGLPAAGLAPSGTAPLRAMIEAHSGCGCKNGQESQSQKPPTHTDSHRHGLHCGHIPVLHDNHIDWLVDGMLHHQREEATENGEWCTLHGSAEDNDFSYLGGTMTDLLQFARW